MLKALSNLAGRIAAAGGSPLRSPGQNFATSLDVAEAERHRSIFGQQETSIANPPGWSIDDLSPGAHGFFPLPEAARRMALTEEETLDLCLRSHLEAYREGSTLLVRPAVVSILAARRSDPPTPTPREAA